MANNTIIIKNATLFFTKVAPKAPGKAFAGGVASWETQIRTTDKKEAKGWKDMNLNVRPLMVIQKDEAGNPVVDDLGEPVKMPMLSDDGKPYYGLTLRKKISKHDGSPNQPVNVVAGDLSPIDPMTIGNESIANLSVFQYDYEYKGKKGIASMLMGMQVTTLNEYTPRPAAGGFEVSSFKVNKISDSQGPDEDFNGSDDSDLDF
jgi:hypothetical protein